MRLGPATAVVLALASVACKSGSGGGGAATTTNGGAFVTEFCALLEPCCEAAGLSTTGQSCQAFASASTQAAYDPSAGAACLAAMQQESTGGTVCATLGGDIPQCSQLFAPVQGSAQPGEPCEQSSDCASASDGGAACYAELVDGGSSTSVCIETVSGQAGDGPCIGTQGGAGTTYDWTSDAALPTRVYVCSAANGTTCDASSGTCVAVATVGQPCAQDSDCVTSAYCEPADGGGQCAPRLANGASCAGAFSGCLSTSTCDPSSMTCQPLLSPGSPCTTAAQCASGDCANQVCVVESSGLLELCGTP
jgi:hypothetical protein